MEHAINLGREIMIAENTIHQGPCTVVQWGSGLFSVSDQQIWQLGSFAAFGWVTVTYKNFEK
jgi:hypothetical protein